MANALQTAGAIAGPGAGLAAGAAFGSAIPGIGTAVGAGVGALLGLIGQIGAGRKTANLMTQGGPQDILDQQLKAIVADPSTDAQGKAQATQVAWTQFLQAANQFASTEGSKAPLVVQQALYKTPGLTNTVSSLLQPLGLTALDPQFTNMVPGITATSLRPGGGTGPGGSTGMTLLDAGLGAAGGLAGQYFAGNGGGGAGASPAGGAPTDTTGGSPTVNADGSISYPGSEGGPAGAAIPNAGTWGTPGYPGGNGTGGAAGAGAGTAGGGGISGIVGSLLKSPLLGAGIGITGALLQGNAAQNAAQLQAAAANNAANLQATASANSLDFLKQVYNTQQTQNAPFLQAGQNALGQIQSLIAPGGALSQPFTAPTAAQAQATPGFQFQLDNALKALSRQSAGVTSGATIKAAENYATGLASQDYQNTYNNALQTYQTNRNNTLNPLLTLAGYGPQAVAQNTAAGNAATSGNTNILQTAAGNIGQLGQSAANSIASGNVQSTNALTNALNQISNMNQLRQILSQSSGG